ncbi:type VI secretion system tip protein TssI/VgrG [Pseudomonas sp. MH10]|uniref:type VI secretion system tip protein TssI/VgrG n=1 Tax=Pseudomonas sp. MH10 TaxID=3048627 RepID=UPI002AC92462|nr:type VI secretion system tip protein TssI/VgrG [Pseudomonas sp. MH10]WPX62633.1 type VI secretion system tip protein TssI/VgrG [Pseudomonas sp. MH10]
MPILNTQKKFTLTVAQQTTRYDLQVFEFSGKESLNQPYCFEIDVVINCHFLDLDDYLHKSAYLCFDDGQDYGVHGVIHEFVQGETRLNMTHYHLKLMPTLFYLSHRTNQRIFQHLTVKEIIAEVLKEHGILTDRYRLEVVGAFEPREYCTQYKESDLQFIQRLCEEEGIHFHFEHSQNHHTVVFSDTNKGFKLFPTPITFAPDNGLNPETVAVKSFSVGVQSKPSRVTRRQYDFVTSNESMDVAFKGYDPETWTRFQVLEDFDYPAPFTSQEHNRWLAIKALERLQVDARLARGTSDQPMLLSGHVFTLEDHLVADWNAAWLLLDIKHRGRQPQVMEAFRSQAPAAAADGFTQGYRNTFTAIPERVTFRPALEHPKPLVLVSQTATVTGPQGEEIYCDEYGRVKVRLRWDRSGSANEQSSRWVRVASSWAGKGYGSQIIPRVGMEVQISYDEGDPDSPIVTGCLFNTVNTVPSPLPANKTQSVFKTLSYPGGGGSNVLEIEDRKGRERIFLQAQRDFMTHALNDHTIEVDNEQRTHVKANAYREFHAEEHHTTHGVRKTQLNADDSLSVAGSINTQAGTTFVVRAGQSAQVQAGAQVVIDAGAQLTLSCGGQHLVLTPAGIFSSSLIVLGGVPIPGTPPAIHPRNCPAKANRKRRGA